ncbi:ABC transporter ATP-binding protein [Dictyobacter alpinus]|uniref:ABC transporter ATP-binding protein n=1 Tax=Dictyobacter alpinus TaxID=2014873 RepID=A0A402BJV4_9CHLR|nr:ABC transporter ATP-binding protein [Dictyobacter alpinus]GCE31629.1 ABC transporter ATP-binding protein [Dictyobacter alpinus]
MNSVVEVHQLTKRYGQVTAVDQISFSLEEGKIYGLLGRNGAGKTTIMQLLTTQIFPTGGDIKIFGATPYENNAVLSQICFIKESQKYPDSFRVVDVLKVMTGFFPNWDREYASALIEDFELPLKRKMKALSRGMLSAVGIIIGLASRAPLTMFDEPYLGLDATARSVFYERLLEDYTEHPRTIILSTHLIDEVSRLLEHVLVINQGTLILNEDAETLRELAFSVVGPAASVEAFSVGKEVIEQKAFGRQLSATILGSLDNAERRRAEAMDLELTAVPLQQLIVHLTNEKRERKAVEAL